MTGDQLSRPTSIVFTGAPAQHLCDTAPDTNGRAAGAVHPARPCRLVGEPDPGLPRGPVRRRRSCARDRHADVDLQPRHSDRYRDHERRPHLKPGCAGSGRDRRPDFSCSPTSHHPAASPATRCSSSRTGRPPTGRWLGVREDVTGRRIDGVSRTLACRGRWRRVFTVEHPPGCRPGRTGRERCLHDLRHRRMSLARSRRRPWDGAGLVWALVDPNREPVPVFPRHRGRQGGSGSPQHGPRGAPGGNNRWERLLGNEETPPDRSIYPGQAGFPSVELGGFEPPTFSLRTRRATNCAIAPRTAED